VESKHDGNDNEINPALSDKIAMDSRHSDGNPFRFWSRITRVTLSPKPSARRRPPGTSVSRIFATRSQRPEILRAERAATNVTTNVRLQVGDPTRFRQLHERLVDFGRRSAPLRTAIAVKSPRTRGRGFQSGNPSEAGRYPVSRQRTSERSIRLRPNRRASMDHAPGPIMAKPAASAARAMTPHGSADVTTNLIALYRALGGGWTIAR
jgi:hypothetical protein